MGRSFVENTATHHHDPAVATVVVDLPNTSFIDVLGVGALIRAKNRAEAAYSVGANGRIVRVFEIAGIADFLVGPKTSKLVGLLRGHKASTLSLAERGQDSPPPAGGGPEASPIRDCKAVPRGHCNQWAGRRTQRLGSPSARRRRRCLGADDDTSRGSAPSLPLRAQARRSCGWFVRDSGWSSRGRWAARHIGGPTSPLGRTPENGA